MGDFLVEEDVWGILLVELEELFDVLEGLED